MLLQGSSGRRRRPGGLALGLWALSLTVVAARAPGLQQPGDQTDDGKRRVCREYARTAVAQNEENQARDCGLTGGMWTLREADIFDWCMDVSLDQFKRTLEERRRSLDESCPDGSAPAPGFCESYAATAVAQHDENLDRGCGFTGPAWQSRYDHHFRWCRGVDQAMAERETEMRRSALAETCPETPSVPPGFCDEVVEESLTQNAENRERGCGFTGERWTLSRTEILRRCLEADPDRVREVLRERWRALAEDCEDATQPGPELTIVPRVVDSNVELALAALARARLNSRQFENQAQRPPGTVFEQEPQPGAEVPVESTVTIWVSTGPPAGREEGPDEGGGPGSTGTGRPQGGPQIPWSLILGGLAGAVVAYALYKLLRPNGRPDKPPPPKPRLEPVKKLGTQRLEVGGPLIAKERKIRT